MPNAADKAQAITDTVNRYVTLLAEGSVDDLVSLYADDATLEDPVGGEVHIGNGAIAGFYSASIWLEANLERECELVSLRVGGNEAAFQLEDHEPHRDVVADRRYRGAGVEELVEAERRRPQVGPAQRVENATDAVQDATDE